MSESIVKTSGPAVIEYVISPLEETSWSMADTARRVVGPVVPSGTVTLYGGLRNTGWWSFSSVTVMFRVVVESLEELPGEVEEEDPASLYLPWHCFNCLHHYHPSTVTIPSFIN